MPSSSSSSSSRVSPLVACILFLVTTFGLFSFLIPIMLDDEDTDYTILNNNDLSSFSSLSKKNIQKVRSLAMEVGKRLRKTLISSNNDDRIPVDNAAASIIYRATAKRNQGFLIGDDLTDVLLSSVISESYPETKDTLVSISKYAEIYFDGSIEGSMEDPFKRLQHDIPSLYVLSICRHYKRFSHGQQSMVRIPFERAATYIARHVSDEGLYDIRNPVNNKNKGGSNGASNSNSNGPMLVVSTLRQAEAAAALRCVGSLFSSITSDSKGEYYLNAGERLRRGLFKFYRSYEEALDGYGPFDLGIAVDPTSFLSSTKSKLTMKDVLSKPLDTLSFKRVRGLTSDLPLLLLFLEHRDLPAQVIQEIADASSLLATPLGLKLGRDLGGIAGNRGGVVGAAGVGAIYSISAPWRVTPIEQAAILIGALKHMLPLSGHTVGSNIGDETGTYDFAAADALSALIDVVLRVAPVLSSLENESAARSSENLRLKLANLQTNYEKERRKNNEKETAILQNMADQLDDTNDDASNGGGLANRVIAKNKLAKLQQLQQDAQLRNKDNMLPSPPPPLAKLLNTTDPLTTLSVVAFNFVFPEHLVPLASGDIPIDPRASIIDISSLDLLRSESGNPGDLFRTRLTGRLNDAGRPDLANAVRAASKGDAAARYQIIQYLLSTMRYPENGLAVIRPSEASAVAVAASLSSNQSVTPVEHVVVEVLRHDHLEKEEAVSDSATNNQNNPNVAAPGPGAKDAIVNPATSRSTSTPTILVRGDGHPLSITTAIAARFFRSLYEAAYTWLQEREQALNGENRNHNNEEKKQAVPGEIYIPALDSNNNNNDNDNNNGILGRIERLRQKAMKVNFKQVTSSNPKHHVVSSASMLLYLTSRAADVSILVDNFNWLKDPQLSTWRQKAGTLVSSSNIEDNNSNNNKRNLLDTNRQKPIPSPLGINYNLLTIYNNLCEENNDNTVTFNGKDLPKKSSHSWYNECCNQQFTNKIRDISNQISTMNEEKSKAILYGSIDAIPTFTCSAHHQEPISVSCAYINDDFCDCEGDAADESNTSACSSYVLGAAFYCPSGIHEIQKGNLVNSNNNDKIIPLRLSLAELAKIQPSRLSLYGYIPASKVKDGIRDCVEGEDEQ